MRWEEHVVWSVNLTETDCWKDLGLHWEDNIKVNLKEV
jgi:hypothetical protein